MGESHAARPHPAFGHPLPEGKGLEGVLPYRLRRELERESSSSH